MIGERTAPPTSFLEHLEGAVEEGWRGTVLAGGWAAGELMPRLDADRVAGELIARLKAIDHDLCIEIDRAVLHLETSLYDRGVLVGYALARTWPAQPDDLDAWPARALAHAGIRTEAEPGDQSGVVATTGVPTGAPDAGGSSATTRDAADTAPPEPGDATPTRSDGATEEERAYLAGLPTEPTPLDPVAVWDQVETQREEREVDPHDAVAVAGLTGLAVFEQSQSYRWTTYERALRDLDIGGLDGVDPLVNQLAWNAVEFGARFGWAWREATLPGMPEGTPAQTLQRRSALLERAYARAGGLDGRMLT